jgi:hypothetical protein
MKKDSWTVYAGIVLLGSLALAADKPVDLSGTWVLDKTEQSFSPLAGGPGEGGGGYPGGGGVGMGGGFPGGGGRGGYPGVGMPGGGGYPGGGGVGRRGGGGYPGGRGEGGPVPGTPLPMEAGELTLAITQTTAEVKVERRWSREGKEQSVVQTFALDGSESHNPDDKGIGELD